MQCNAVNVWYVWFGMVLVWHGMAWHGMYAIYAMYAMYAMYALYVMYII